MAILKWSKGLKRMVKWAGDSLRPLRLHVWDEVMARSKLGELCRLWFVCIALSTGSCALSVCYGSESRVDS